jgi:hypothetical protein
MEKLTFKMKQKPTVIFKHKTFKFRPRKEVRPQNPKNLALEKAQKT